MAVRALARRLRGGLRRRLADPFLPPVNLVREPSPNYAQVQDDVVAPIRAVLPRRAWRHTVGVGRDGAVNLTLFIRQPGNVLLSHGLADKRYLWISDEQGERLINRFEHVLVPGAWHRRALLATRTVTLPEHRIHVVGWPRLDTLLAARDDQARWDPPRDRRRLRVLWAPTHDLRKRGPEQRSTSSYPDFEAALPHLAERFDVDVSLHPRNRRDKRPTGEQLLWADVVVSDFGTMVYEAWALGKPVVFPRWILGDRVARYLPRAAEGLIHRERIGHHVDSLEELIEVVEAGAPVGADVHAFLDDYLDPSSYGRSGARVALVLEAARRGLEVADLPRRVPGVVRRLS